MKIVNKPFLQFIYSCLLCGVPQYSMNPLNQNRILAELNVQQYSSYVNYKLNDTQVNVLNNYIKEYNDDLDIVPIKLSKYSYPNYYLSVNMYNATSPIMMTNKDIIRCELNTYVKTKDGVLGTLILDYVSNTLSMDPVNIFKKNVGKIKFDNNYNLNRLFVDSEDDELYLDLTYKLTNDDYYISKKLVEFTDLAYYKNGVADKVYYDSTLGQAVTKYGELMSGSIFKYKGLEFYYPDSVFYFDNSLNFIGSVWYHLG